MKCSKWYEGQQVHVDTDHDEWGRVASDGTVVEVRTRSLLVNAESIRANILVPKRDAWPVGENAIRPQIHVNPFVCRQIASSPFSHFDGPFEAVAVLASQHFEEGHQGYREGVWIVPVPPDKFFSAVVRVTPKTPLVAVFAARRQDEAPFIQVQAKESPKLPAKAVELVLYRHDVLAADASTSKPGEWELISINARPTEAPEPIMPVAMMRNFQGLPGGTKATYTAEEFAESIRYWMDKAMAAG